MIVEGRVSVLPPAGDGCGAALADEGRGASEAAGRASSDRRERAEGFGGAVRELSHPREWNERGSP
ncbi:hypothetical protein GCM10008985_29220 [Halococcus dombrowskii]|uniref:Uncharacterized protein n=1 Tax=Halococcus dombrowskii TaxID=179637 RepID=A0AAV3SKE3_HALDO